MTPDAAMALAIELASAYPGRGIPDVTIAQYAAAFTPCDRERAVLAVGDVVQRFPDRAPTLGQVREALRIREAEVQPALPPREDIGYTSGPPISEDAWSHGKYHLAELLRVPRDRRTEDMRIKATHPERCGCDARWPAGKRMGLVP